MTKIIVLIFCVLSVLIPRSYAQKVMNNDVVNIANNIENNDKTTDIDLGIARNKEDSGKSNVKKIQSESKPKVNELPVIEKTPEVGKHVMANMDAGSMIVSLLMVLALIIVSAFVLKRFNLTQQNSSQLRVIASLSLGAKEKVIVVQIGEEQLVLGVCPAQISLLKNLETPIESQTVKSAVLSGGLVNFLQKHTEKIEKTESNSNSATSDTIKNNK